MLEGINEGIKEVEVLYLNTEETFYLNKIKERNRQMVDGADLIICYVDFSKRRSGAKTAVNYAKRKGKAVINLFKEKRNKIYL